MLESTLGNASAATAFGIGYDENIFSLFSFDAIIIVLSLYSPECKNVLPIQAENGEQKASRVCFNQLFNRQNARKRFKFLHSKAFRSVFFVSAYFAKSRRNLAFRNSKSRRKAVCRGFPALQKRRFNHLEKFCFVRNLNGRCFSDFKAHNGAVNFWRGHKRFFAHLKKHLRLGIVVCSHGNRPAFS